MKLIKAALFWIPVWTFTIFIFLRVLGVSLVSFLRRDPLLSHHCHNLAGQWGRGILKMTPGWTYRIRGQQHLPPSNKPLVVVANHQSSVDICALYLLGIQFRWLSKAEIFKIPFVGSGMKLAGYVPIKRGDKISHEQAFESSRQWLRQGVSMVYFPEGSRSTDGQLKPFKPGAFRLSELEKVDVLPVIIRGTKSMMAKNSLVPHPSHVDLEVLPPTARRDHESVEDFMDRVRSSMLDTLSQPLPERVILSSQKALTQPTY
ncbi:lysophospholipid acyltransferase family protein [Pseudobacteriovorax antillogorgiicola]|uniref:1-acyl-sn-glycerol-3-phosphate acyltransferase n=1 Tax=Pseudobacteriovorax antillogorgiicola TaxID=1513793 RepID=A0A1Y6B6H0_9BACT|nr:lysophospholipid acyltransferase family protein [Pseudobacteriovorax antillogorgiicola]TCS58794.1 1-acyl-sn-glycerol-3-phosphate acyltransferase [Pseudobacteriovorax antillogorgiicola]SME94652.1 1-acyl-sn-glycerol-3-phosphate acyltransferase [Pseudobacteriovorax antillogorgiicola]